MIFMDNDRIKKLKINLAGGLNERRCRWTFDCRAIGQCGQGDGEG